MQIQIVKVHVCACVFVCLCVQVLRSCHVVLMTARDEASSFRIFSTLNSRGMDLSMVDKLKADVFEVRMHTHT